MKIISIKWHFTHIVVLVSIFAFSTSSFAQELPKDDLYYYVKAENFRKQGKYANAIEEYRKAIGKDKTDYAFLYGKAQAESELHETDSAIISLNKSIGLKHDYAPAYALLAQAYYHKDDHDKFISSYDSAAKYELDIKTRHIYSMIVINNYIKNKNFEVAYKKAKLLQPFTKDDVKLCYLYMRLANLNKEYQETVNTFLIIENELKKLPINESTKYYFELGYAYFHQEQFEKANDVWEKIQINPFAERIEKYSAKYFIDIARIYIKFHEIETAMEYLLQAENIDKRAKTNILKAQISERSEIKNNQDYFQSMRNALDSEKGKRSATKLKTFFELINSYLISEKYNESMQVVNEALHEYPNELRLKFEKALTFYKLKQHKEARGLIQQVLKEKISPIVKMDFLFLLGLNAKKNNNTPLAIESFTKLLKSKYKKAAQIELTSLR